MIYRHIKTGNLYRLLLDHVWREHDVRPVVVYLALRDGTMWCRPRDEFHERFELVGVPPVTLNREPPR